MTDDEIKGLFYSYGQYVSGKDYALIRAIEKVIAPQRTEQEPYAYTYLGIKNDGSQHGPHLCWKPEYMDVMSHSKGAVAVPLYTRPPQRTEQMFVGTVKELFNNTAWEKLNVRGSTKVYIDAMELPAKLKEMNT